jgi:hypothetical protein
MKTKIKFSVAILLLSFFTINADAQIKRNGWYGNPIIGTDNPIYYVALEKVVSLLTPQSEKGYNLANDREIDDERDKLVKKLSKTSFFLPRIDYRVPLVHKMKFANGNARIHPKLAGLSHIDWPFRNYSLGYRVGYMPRVSHIGIELEADYIQDGYQVRMPDKYDVEQSIIKRMLSGKLLLQYRFGKYDESNTNFLGIIGGAYNYALHYHDKEINDKDAVNNGFVGTIGFGAVFPQYHTTLSLRYEHAFYDFYNDKYIHNDQPVFEGSKSSFGKLLLSMDYSF